MEPLNAIINATGMNFGFFSRLSAFEPVNNLMPPLRRPSSPEAEMTSCRNSAETSIRNWMVDKDGDSEDKSVSDGDSSLPSPSNLPFYPRKRRESRKERRARTTFSQHQTQILETEYHHSEYISRPRRYELATQLGLKEVQIKIWYQNRRAKDKRIEKASWDRQYRCLGLAAAVAASTQFPGAVNYRLTAEQLQQHPLNMFPSPTSGFGFPLLGHLKGDQRCLNMGLNNKMYASNVKVK